MFFERHFPEMWSIGLRKFNSIQGRDLSLYVLKQFAQFTEQLVQSIEKVGLLSPNS